MRTAVTALVIAFCMGGVARSQEFVAPKRPEAPRPAPPAREPRPAIEGIVAEIFRTRQPWQLINPLAPKAYGSGEENVSRDPKDPAKPKGFILFAFEW